MKPRLYVMCGLPASGKSFVAEELAFIEDDLTIFSSDKYREKLLGNENDQTNNQLVFDTLYKDLRNHLEQGKSAIFDATNTTLKSRLTIMEKLKGIDCKKIIHIMTTPYEICVQRDKNRKRSVGESVIYKFLSSFQCPQYFEGWDNIKIEPTSVCPNEFDLFRFYDLITYMMTFDQENPHHLFTLGQHSKNIYNKFVNDADQIRALAGIFHDIGKLKTKKKDEAGIAHYYNHDNIGTYILLSNPNVVLNDLDHPDFLEVLFYINYHMKAHKDFRGEKAYKKYCKIFGKTRLDMLIEFADADIIASGTSDIHEQVLDEIKEAKANVKRDCV